MAAAALSMQVSAASVSNADQIRDVIQGIGSETGKGVVVLPIPITFANRGLIIALLGRHHLPAIYEQPLFVREGGLVSYGVDNSSRFSAARPRGCSRRGRSSRRC
jgi:hypothetical protein